MSSEDEKGQKEGSAPELGNGVVRVVDRLPALLAQDAHAHIRRLQ